MVAGVCVALLAAAWLAHAASHKERALRIDRRDLPRLRLLGERIKRMEIYPFE